MTGRDDNDHSGDKAPEPAAAETARADAHDDMDPLMLDLLVCPLTKQPLTFDAAAHELVSDAAGLAYPVRGGIPVLLPSEARSLREDGP